MEDKNLAVRLADKILKHASAGYATRNRNLMCKQADTLAYAVDWPHVPEKFLPTLIAIRLAGTWLDGRVPGVLDLNRIGNSNDDNHKISNGEPQMQDRDVKMLTHILEFATKFFKNSSCDVAWEYVETNTKVLQNYKQHARWAQKMRQAVTHGFESENALARMLMKDKDSIPLSFISFLSSESADRAQTDRAAEVYHAILLGDTPSDKFKKFLPATDEAKKKSAAAGRLSDWLEQTVRNGSSEILKHKIQSLQDSIKAAHLTSFPECLGKKDFENDSALQGAVSVFMDSAHPRIGNVGSDFIDREARHILNTYSESEDPLEVPTKARKQIKHLIEQVLKGGKILHNKVRLQITLDDANFKREQRALVALLDDAGSRHSIDQFLHLVQIDPVRLLHWSSVLSDFFRDTLLPDLPPGLENFLEVYKEVDVKGLHFFCVDAGSDQHDTGPSICHMLDTFKNILKDVKQTAWPQISSLPKLSSLVQVMREKLKDKDTLQRKMNALRMVRSI